MFRAGEFQQAFGIEPRINYYNPKGEVKMAITNGDYKTAAKLFVENDIRHFLIRHGNEELDEGAMLSIAMDVFKGKSKEIESVKLYIAIRRRSNVLIGNYDNNTSVKRAEIVGELIISVVNLYNLIVRLYNKGLYTEYREITEFINDMDILFKSVPGNIRYDRLAGTLSELYLKGLAKIAEKTLEGQKETET